MKIEQANSAAVKGEIVTYLSEAEVGMPSVMAFSDMVVLARAEQQYRELVPFPNGNRLTPEIVRVATRVEMISARVDERTDSIRGYASAYARVSRLRDDLVEALELQFPQEGQTMALNNLEEFRRKLLLP